MSGFKQTEIFEAEQFVLIVDAYQDGCHPEWNAIQYEEFIDHPFMFKLISELEEDILLPDFMDALSSHIAKTQNRIMPKFYYGGEDSDVSALAAMLLMTSELKTLMVIYYRIFNNEKGS